MEDFNLFVNNESDGGNLWRLRNGKCLNERKI
jgi:hypothetical protein